MERTSPRVWLNRAADVMQPELEADLIRLGHHDDQLTERDVVTDLLNSLAASNNHVLESRNSNRWIYHLLQAQSTPVELDAFLSERAIRPPLIRRLDCH